MSVYDYLVVGAGLFGAVFARKMHDAGKKILVIEKRAFPGGNIRCENIEGINVHVYGAHIFHTNNKKVWDFVTGLTDFNRYTHTVLANHNGRIYNLPFNMNTFYALWGVKFPEEARQKIRLQREAQEIKEPRNLEEQAVSLVGRDIYETLIKGYTEKQWGRPCSSLPAFIIRRLPVRWTFDNAYFNDAYQGIPVGGYNKIIERLLDGIEVKTNADFFEDRNAYLNGAKKTVYTGPIDRFYDFRYGRLEYRTVRFETEILNCDNYQGAAVVNYTDSETPWTRIIEHKHFEGVTGPVTVISREYSAEGDDVAEPFYPVNDEKNSALYKKYAIDAAREERVIFGGRLAEYAYYDMDKVIESAFRAAEVCKL